MTDITEFKKTMKLLVKTIKESKLSNNDLIGCLEIIKLDLIINRRLISIDGGFGEEK